MKRKIVVRTILIAVAILVIGGTVRYRGNIQIGSSTSEDTPASNIATQNQPTNPNRATIPSDEISTTKSINANAAQTNFQDIPNVVYGVQGDIPEEVVSWSRNTYQGNDKPVIAERYRFIRVRSDDLRRSIEYSTAYQAAQIGRSAPPPVDPGTPTFVIEIFPDKFVGLEVLTVTLDSVQNIDYVILKGNVLPYGGYFSLITTSGYEFLKGTIDMPDSFVRLDTPFNHLIIAIAEYNRMKIEAADNLGN